MGRISVYRIDRDEQSITDGGNHGGKRTGVKKKRSCLEKGHCSSWLEEEVWKRKFRFARREHTDQVFPWAQVTQKVNDTVLALKGSWPLQVSS